MSPHSNIAISGGGRDVKNARRRIEVFERLQNHTDPKLFMPRCIFDGAAIMYSPRELPLSGRDSQTVRVKSFESELLTDLYLWLRKVRR
jgi:hypothetical protein